MASYTEILNDAEYDLICGMRRLKLEYNVLMANRDSPRNDRAQTSWQDRLENVGMSYMRAEEVKRTQKQGWKCSSCGATFQDNLRACPRCGYTVYSLITYEVIVKDLRESKQLCKKVVGIKPSWMGTGQWDSTKCECLLNEGHEGECKCKHMLEGESK